jgi:hypothetical protein
MLKLIVNKKGYLLTFATLILLTISYLLAFKPTIEVWKNHSVLKQQLISSANPGIAPAYLERKNANLTKALAFFQVDTSLIRNNIINKIASIADNENVKLAEVPVQDPAYDTTNFTIEKLQFEGDYFSLMKFATKLQSTKGVGVIRSESWESIISRNGEKVNNKLVLEIYLEVLKKYNFN